MSQNNENCKGLTKSGEQCQLKPGSSGYCHLHDPERIAAERLAEEETERKAKAAKDAEFSRRSQQLEEITVIFPRKSRGLVERNVVIEFKLIRAEITERRMTAATIIKALNVQKDVRFSFGPRAITAVMS